MLAFASACQTTDRQNADSEETGTSDGDEDTSGSRGDSDGGHTHDCTQQTFASTWEAIQVAIFEQHGCTSAVCHGSADGQGGLDLRAEVAFDNLINVPATAPLTKPLDRVFPGEQKMSLLYLKLAAATLGEPLPAGAGDPMPSGLPAISPEQLEAVRLWIRGGAPESGIVAGTAEQLGCGPQGGDPLKVPPLEPPPHGEGVQLYAPPRPLPAMSEGEVCFVTYYDFTTDPGTVPDWAQKPCPDEMGGSGRMCLLYHDELLVQDPQSHHSIIQTYVGQALPNDPGWGEWHCLGGEHDGSTCDPAKIGVPAEQGSANCGPRSGCATRPAPGVACIGIGPPDFNATTTPSFSGSQSPVVREVFPDGVYFPLPVKGYVVWNTHAFNVTDEDSDLEQYVNLYFAGPEHQKYPLVQLTDDTDIFVVDVPPFEQREYCRSYTLPQTARLTRLSSHVHKRGILFRTWEPPNDPGCVPLTGCASNPAPPIYVSTKYDDVVELFFDPPWAFDSADAATRTLKYCGTFDNGAQDPTRVKRQSTSPSPPAPYAPGGPCTDLETRCIGGPKHNQSCYGNDAACESSPGAGDGDCDACPLRGGVTTEDEMFIFAGSYYLKTE